MSQTFNHEGSIFIKLPKSWEKLYLIVISLWSLMNPTHIFVILQEKFNFVGMHIKDKFTQKF